MSEDPLTYFPPPLPQPLDAPPAARPEAQPPATATAPEPPQPPQPRRGGRAGTPVRGKAIPIRLGAVEMDRYRESARQEGQTLSDWCRAALARHWQVQEGRRRYLNRAGGAA